MSGHSPQPGPWGQQPYPQQGYPQQAYPQQPYSPNPGYPYAPQPMHGMPMSALPAGPLGGSERQWAARIRQMIRSGATREEILGTMGQANWPFEQAMDLIKKTASKERWAAIWMLLGFGFLALLGVVIFIAEINSTREEIHGGEFAFFVTGIAGGIYGLVRLTKMRA